MQKDVVNNIISNSQYRKAVENSQWRLWRPYMLAVAGHWCKFNGCKLKADMILSKKYYPALEN